MSTTILLPNKKSILSNTILDAFGLAFIYFVPVLSHLFALPIYYIEPMRIIVILSLAHGHKSNSYLLALTLPIFSFLVSTHPVFIKSGLISVELIFNVFLFYFIYRETANKLMAISISIIASKIFYYAIKFILISTAVLETKLIATPILIQIGIIIALSIYICIFLNIKNRNNF
ncbi:MAG: hypothetical protein K9J16_00830 [Melioribacteraceae bacterium]|nr:hypothetical protein [Melioribacteraceae bacterium]MCF8354049.1 hypothetical protein [Melioribacteraceae bacterium]MCF8392270.1 hypothetical protein [Melioribacteraceae bacterium]MCF8417602.1 hypothetical protein [Melioribacteraceae bacterium]